MAPLRCPGQDQRFWKPQDISEHACPHCGAAVEFWKDDSARRCPSCGGTVRNPGFDAGCAAWCPSAGRCSLTGGDLAEGPEADGKGRYRDVPDA